MSEVATKSELTPEQEAVLASKRTAWANMGESVYIREMRLQAQCQEQLRKIIIPKNIDEVPMAEGRLKEIKQALQVIEKQRKEITLRFDELSGRLMQPEKDLALEIGKYASAIVSVKSEHEKIERIKKQKADEVKVIKERIGIYLAECDRAYREGINEKSTAAYQHALNTDVKPDELDLYLEKVYKKLTASNFFPAAPTFNLYHVDTNELEQIMDECMVRDPDKYVKLWHESLVAMFSNYDVAYANKKDALELATREKEAKDKQIADSSENQKVAASIQANAQTLELRTGPVVKDLKRSYEVDMPNTVESAMLLWTCFAANKSACLAKMGAIKNWLDCKTSSIATAIAKLKNDDNAFQFSGIVFKEVEKL